MAECEKCGHEHAGPELAGICIGCPCPVVATEAPKNGVTWKLAFFPVEREGVIWLVDSGEDQGILLRLGRADHPHHGALRSACVPFDLGKVPATPRPAAVPPFEMPKPKADDGETVHSVFIGGVRVRSRLVHAVLAMHPGVTWYAPADLYGGPVHAVNADGEMVALIAGLAVGPEETAESHKRGIRTVATSR